MRAIVAGRLVELELQVVVEGVEIEQAGVVLAELSLIPMDCHLMVQLVLITEYHSCQMLQGAPVIDTVAEAKILMEQFTSM